MVIYNDLNESGCPVAIGISINAWQLQVQLIIISFLLKLLQRCHVVCGTSYR